MKNLVLGVSVLILVLTLILVGCAESAAPASTTTTPTSAAPAPTKTAPTVTMLTTTSGPQYGGILKIIASPGLKNMGFPGATEIPGDVQCRQPAIEALLGVDPEKGCTYPKPLLATSWEIAPDYSSITFNLRKGVKFHDGTDFNAEAAKFNLDLHREGYRADLKTVESIDILDDYTIRLNLSSYVPTLLYSLTSAVSFIASPTAIKTMGEEAMLHPVGTGPFKFVSYKRDVSLKFETFDGYWQEGKPYLDGMEYIFIQDATVSLASFEAGEAHICSGRLTPKDTADLIASGKYKYTSRLGGGTNGLAGDSAHSDSPFADIRVRQAVAHAIDKESICETLGFGYWEAATQLHPKACEWYNPEVKGYPYNPDKARELLTEAGYPNGIKTEIMYESSTTNNNLFTAVQGYLSKVGIDVKLQALDRGTMADTTISGWNKSMVAFSYTNPGSTIDPATFLVTKLSDTANRYNPECLYTSPAYNAKIYEAIAEIDPQKRVMLWQELGKICHDECLYMPIYASNGATPMYPEVQDYESGTYCALVWRPEVAWLSK